LTVSYSLAATERASPSAGNSLFASRIFIYASQNQLRGENASIGSLSKISPHLEQMRNLVILRGKNRQRQVRGVGWAEGSGREADFSAALLTEA
jgi:hypothetical protein